MTSEPHIRAVIAEKWSANLAKAKNLPVPSPCVWVGSEVCDGNRIEDVIYGQRVPFVSDPAVFDLKMYPLGGRTWPFARSVFQAIRLP
jgi:hypothetical protein